ncbi:MAG: SRPBCC family protein [Myxococcota bacterium]
MTTLIAAFALTFVVLIGLTLLLPRRRTVSRERFVPASAETIFELVASNRGYQAFNPYKDKDPELKIEMFGPESGVGSGFSFHGKDGKGTQTVASVVENESVTLQLDLGPMGRPVTTFTFEPKSGGTQVRWATTAQFGLNPLARVFGLFLDRFLGPDYDRGLQLLAAATTR